MWKKGRDSVKRSCDAELPSVYRDRRDMLRLYIKAVGYVLIAYAVMIIGYLPAVISQATDAISLMQETLEIGAYKPIIVTASSISSGLFYAYRLQKPQIKREKKTLLTEVLKSCLRSGVVAVLSFNVYFVVLMSVLPIKSPNPIEQFSGAPHSSIYLCNSIIPCIVFHSLLLFVVGIFASTIFMSSYCSNHRICVSYSFTILMYQIITYSESILRIPRKYKIDAISSGWFRVGTDTPLLDLIWAIIVVSVHSIPFALFILRQRNDGEKRISE